MHAIRFQWVFIVVSYSNFGVGGQENVSQLLSKHALTIEFHNKNFSHPGNPNDNEYYQHTPEIRNENCKLRDVKIEPVN